MASTRSFGETVRERRLDLGLSQGELAEKSTALDQSLVSKIENGIIADPGVSVAYALAVALGLTIEQLMGGAPVSFEVPHRPRITPPDRHSKLEKRVAVLEAAALEAAVTAREALALAQQLQEQLSQRRKNANAS